MPVSVPVAAQVRQAVETHPALGQLLGQGLVNLRATARYLQEQGMVLPDQSEAVVSALRRLRGGRQGLNSRCLEILGQAEIKIHAPVASITMRHPEGSTGLSHLDAELLALLRARWQITSPQGIRLVVPEANLAGAEARILAVPDLQLTRGLAEVALVVTPDARRLPGILAVACQRLALHGVNIIETVDGFNQHTFLVAQAQVDAAVRALKPAS